MNFFGLFGFLDRQASRRELDEERISKHIIKDKLTTTESQLRQTRVRVTKMDRQLREAEATITSLTASVKSLEDQVYPFQHVLLNRAKINTTCTILDMFLLTFYM